MGSNACIMKRGGAFLSAFGASCLAVTPCFAIETGGAPALPPPPPPAASPASSPPPPARPQHASVAPATVSTSDSAAPAADTGPTPEGGMHALDTRWFIAPMLGYLSDDLDFGIGLRGGKTLDNHIYIGGTFIYQVGESGGGTVATGLGTTTSYSWSSSGFYLGPEGGYDFDLRYVVLRPYMGLGIFSYGSSASGPGASASASSTRFVVWPGCSVIWNIPNSNFFLGGDARVVSVPGAAFGMYAMGGLHFGT
jgi:hypothetical protein